jgi:hypothetical protein
MRRPDSTGTDRCRGLPFDRLLTVGAARRGSVEAGNQPQRLRAASSEFAEALGLADRTTDGPRGTAYEFFLPLSTQALQELFDDELVHRPELTVIVDPESGMIVRCIVDEIRF